MAQASKRNICFVTGTRAEYGLMRSTLQAIDSHPGLHLQLIATGMHLDLTRGNSINVIRDEGWKIDHVVRWPKNTSQASTAAATGHAMALLAKAFDASKSDIVLVVGDRVEAFAAAAAGHISGRLIAHVHGGDRALGLVDDSLRHAISKLAHVHFPATEQSAGRLRKMGEDAWRIHTVGSPGLDDLAEAESRDVVIKQFPGLQPRKFVLLVLHPASSQSGAERLTAETLLAAVKQAGVEQIVIIYPNNDPGADGITACWTQAQRQGNPHWYFRRDLPRLVYLALLRDAAMLVGNSSSGIIEAAGFGTPVIDVGPRQEGRERGGNVLHVDPRAGTLERAIQKLWNHGKVARSRVKNLYGAGGAGISIASALSRVDIPRHVRKLIAY